MTTVQSNFQPISLPNAIPVVKNTEDKNPFVEIPAAQRQFITFCVSAYAILVCVLGLLEASRMSDRILLLMSSVFMIFVIAGPIIFSFRQSGFLHPLVITSAFVLLNTVLRQTDVLASGLQYHLGLPGYSAKSLTELVIFVNILTITAFLAKYAGYFCMGNLSFAAIKFNKKPNSLFVPLLILWFLLGILALFLLTQASGGLLYHLKNINRGDKHKVFVGDTSLLGTYAFFIQSTVIVPVLYAAFIKRGHKSITFFAMILFSAAMVYLTNGRRSALLAPIYLGIGVWIFKERKLPLVRIAIVGFGMFLFLAVGSLFRDANRSHSSQVNWDFLVGKSVSDLAEISMGELSDRSGNAAAIYPIIVHVPDRYPFNYFKSYLENVYRFIPRAIWPDKPQGIGIECAEKFYGRYNAGGIPPGQFGEAYWSMGIFGVIVAFFVFGMFLKLIGNHFLENPKSMGILSVYLLTALRLKPDQISFRIWIFTIVPLMVFLLATNLISLKGRGS